MASNRAGPRVLLAAAPFLLEQIRAAPDRHARMFERARTEVGYAECMCSAPARRLVIRLREGRFHLAVWPGDGPSHAAECPFHRLDASASGLGGYSREAVFEDERGMHVRLDAALSLTGASVADASPVVSADSVSRSRATMGLKGLFDLLWEQAGLHRFAPSLRRSWWHCHRALMEQVVSDVTVNRQPLGQALLVVPPYRGPAAPGAGGAVADFLARLGAKERGRRRGLVLGEVKSVAASQYGFRISLRHLREPLFAGEELVTRVRSSHRAAFSGTRAEDSRQLGLFLVERTERGYLVVADAAVVLTSVGYIPVESSYELAMIDALLAAGRRGVKPLRYDARADVVFPDFVLVDDPEAADTVVEVWGITGRADYERRKAEKIRYYQESGRTLLQWTVTEPMPELRLPRSRAR